MRLIALMAVYLFLTATARAAPADLAGWREARWGMTEDELATAFGADLRALPGR